MNFIHFQYLQTTKFLHYNKFIYHAQSSLSPLKKNKKFIWSKECDISFNKLKSEIASDKVLTHYNPKFDLVIAKQLTLRHSTVQDWEQVTISRLFLHVRLFHQYQHYVYSIMPASYLDSIITLSTRTQKTNPFICRLFFKISCIPFVLILIYYLALFVLCCLLFIVVSTC